MENTETFTPSEAVNYLREHRGMILTVDALRQRRKRKTVNTNRVYKNMALWTKQELDAIAPSHKTKRVPPAVQQQDAALLDNLAGITDSERPEITGSSEGTTSMLSTRYLRPLPRGLPSWLMSSDPDDDIPDDEKPDIKHRSALALAEV